MYQDEEKLGEYIQYPSYIQKQQTNTVHITSTAQRTTWFHTGFLLGVETLVETYEIVNGSRWNMRHTCSR